MASSELKLKNEMKRDYLLGVLLFLMGLPFMVMSFIKFLIGSSSTSDPISRIFLNLGTGMANFISQIDILRLVFQISPQPDMTELLTLGNFASLVVYGLFLSGLVFVGFANSKRKRIRRLRNEVEDSSIRHSIRRR